MRDRFYQWLAQMITRHNVAVLVVCALFTAAMIMATGRLSMKTQFADMLPKGIPLVEEWEQIIKDYSSTSTIMIAVDSKNKDTKLMKQAAEKIVLKLRDLKRISPNAQTLGQKLALMGKDHPVPGVVYDTVDLVRRIDYKIDNEFISKHGMMMQKPKDLENFITMFGSLKLSELVRNINDNFEKEFVDDQENLNSLDGEVQAVQGLDGVYTFLRSMGAYLDDADSIKASNAVKKFISGQEYIISSDNTMLLLMLQPAVDYEQYEALMELGYHVVDSLNMLDKHYQNLEIGASGGIILGIDETEAIKKDFGWPSLAALLFILVLLISSFRTWKNPFFSVVTLVIALIWVTGMLALVLHYLNMMSASFGIILVGLGIDFGIHFISGFRDAREEGLNIEDSVYNMYSKVGAGILTGGMTTAIVFLTLALTRFQALTEMGIAVGGGIIITLIAMMVLLPALIVWDNKGYSVIGNLLRKIKLGFTTVIFTLFFRVIYAFFSLKIFRIFTNVFQFRFLEASGRLISKTPIAIAVLVITAITVYLSINAAKRIEFEYDMMKLEPEGIPSGIVQDKILERFEISPDYAMVVAKNEEECRNMIKNFKKLGNRTELIGQVNGITEYIQELEYQQRNIPLIEDFKHKLQKAKLPSTFASKDMDVLNKEIKRLHQNIVEIGELSISGRGENNKIIRKCDEIVGEKDEDSKLFALVHKLMTTDNAAQKMSEFQSISAKIMQHKLLHMTSPQIITLDNLSGNLRERFVNDNNGNLLITIYPKSNIWEERTLRKFITTTEKINERITGLPGIMLLFMDLMREKGKLATIFGACAIILFLLIDFRSIGYTVGATIPLAVGAIWMLGLMALFEIKFNVSNFMALPLIIGIGIDDGVHVLHRYRIEGKGSMPLVVRFTGRAILLTSLTTMIGFGSMGLASHRGIASMGQVLFLGVGSCFISSAYVLPSLITMFEKIFKKSGNR